MHCGKKFTQYFNISVVKILAVYAFTDVKKIRQLFYASMVKILPVYIFTVVKNSGSNSTLPW